MKTRPRMTYTRMEPSDDLTYLATRHAHPRDAHIRFFEEEHIYTVRGVRVGTSVTSLCKSPFREFDADKVIRGMMRKNWPREEYVLPIKNWTAPEDTTFRAGELGDLVSDEEELEEVVEAPPLQLEKDTPANRARGNELLRQWAAAKQTHDRTRIETARSRFAPLTPRSIKARWARNGKVSSEAGTAMHNRIELFYNQLVRAEDTGTGSEAELLAEVAVLSKELRMFRDFHTSYMRGTYEPYRTEWLIYDEEYDIAGAIDFLVWNPVTKRHKILDWKRAKAIRKTNKFSKGAPPLEHLDDCNYIKYALQLNVYRVLLEKNYGLTIEGQALVILHPNNETYCIEELPTFREEALHLLNRRKAQLKTNV